MKVHFEDHLLRPDVIQIRLFWLSATKDADVKTKNRRPVTWSDMIKLWQQGAFCSVFLSFLKNVSFEEIIWESQPVSSASCDFLPFELLLLDVSGKLDGPGNSKFFRDQNLAQPSSDVDDSVVVEVSHHQLCNNSAALNDFDGHQGREFRDLTVAPRRFIGTSHENYGHFAAFLRGAPEAQQLALWRELGIQLGKLLRVPAKSDTCSPVQESRTYSASKDVASENNPSRLLVVSCGGSRRRCFPWVHILVADACCYDTTLAISDASGSDNSNSKSAMSGPCSSSGHCRVSSPSSRLGQQLSPESSPDSISITAGASKGSLSLLSRRDGNGPNTSLDADCHTEAASSAVQGPSVVSSAMLASSWMTSNSKLPYSTILAIRRLRQRAAAIS